MAAGKTGVEHRRFRKYVRFPKRMTLGRRGSMGKNKEFCGRSGLRGALLAAGTPPPRLAAASARAWADRVGSGGRRATTTVLRASVHCNGRLWAERACSSSFVWAHGGAVVEGGRESASRGCRRGWGLPCAGPTLRCELGARTPASCAPPAIPRQSPWNIPACPEGWGAGWVRTRARLWARARAWGVLVNTWAPLVHV